MAVTQYIGARYVPLFYTNPNDGTNAWQAGVAYDPLTIVTDLNQSYTSKIPVPASVGRPSENPTYWIMTGAYSAQLEQYHQEVMTLQEDVDTNTEAIDTLTEVKVNKRGYLLIGDSYADGWDGTTNVNGWPVAFKNMLHLTNSECITAAVGGAGFVGDGNAFITLMQNAVVADPDIITDIVVAGGRNDSEADNNVLASALGTFYTTAVSMFPNLKRVWLCFCGAYRNRTVNTTDKLQNVKAIYESDHRFITIPQAATALCINPSFYSTADPTHFNEAGYAFLGRWIASGVMGGRPTAAKPFSVATLTALNGVTLQTTNFEYRIENDTVSWLKGAAFGTMQIGSTKPTAGTPFYFASIPEPFFGGYNATGCAIPVTASVHTKQGQWLACAATLIFYRGQIGINIIQGAIDGDGFVNLANCSAIYLPDGIYSFHAPYMFG